MKKIRAADLFCGGGGFTTGLYQALQAAGYKSEQIEVVAINHWNIAIATHKENHPDVKHFCTSLDDTSPLSVVPDGKLDILVAGPQCTYYSRARGGKPVTDQQRASPWIIIRWMEELDITNVIVENVPELTEWGPVSARTSRPLKKYRGRTFLAWIMAMRSLGYNVDWRILNAADYGDATTRRRLFVVARKGARKITWPSPTHSGVFVSNNNMLFGEERKPWVPIREIIDWSNKGQSIYDRKKPLSENTMRRIESGMMKFNGAFLVKLYTGSDAVSLDEPAPTITAEWNHLAIARPEFVPVQKGGSLLKPFVFKLNHGKGDERFYPTDDPIKTITGADSWGLVKPYLIKYYGTSDVSSVDEPMPTATTKSRFGIARPIVVKINDNEYMLDIYYRMLTPDELAKATGFPRDYRFVGNRKEIVKQIGNAVPVNTARALCSVVL